MVQLPVPAGGAAAAPVAAAEKKPDAVAAGAAAKDKKALPKQKSSEEVRLTFELLFSLFKVWRNSVYEIEAVFSADVFIGEF